MYPTIDIEPVNDTDDELLSVFQEEIGHMLDAMFRENTHWFCWEQGRCSALIEQLERYHSNEELINFIKKSLEVMKYEYDKPDFTWEDYINYFIANCLDYLN